MKEIQKDTAKIKKEIKFSWKINSKTDWHNYQQHNMYNTN